MALATVRTTWRRWVEGGQGMVGMLTAPLAAVLVLVISLRRRWRLRVLGLLWLLVTVAMGMTFPAIDAAMQGWMVLPGTDQGP